MKNTPESVAPIARTLKNLGNPHFERRLGGSQGAKFELSAAPAQGISYPRENTLLFDLQALKGSRLQALLSGVLRYPDPNSSGSIPKYPDLEMDLRTHCELFDQDGKAIPWPMLGLPIPESYAGPRLARASLQVGAQQVPSGLTLTEPGKIYEGWHGSYGGVATQAHVLGNMSPAFCNLEISTGIQGNGRGISVTDASASDCRTVVRAWSVPRFYK